MFDIIVCGGGLAGLYAALCFLDKNSHQRILILEAENRLGGRIHTIQAPWQHESGAGRIHMTHERVLSLFRRYGIEIGEARTIEPGFVSLTNPDTIQKNTFSQDIKPIIKAIRLMGSEAARETTLAAVAAVKFPVLWQNIRYKYPYSGEFFIANAWEAACALENTMTITGGWVFPKLGNEELIRRISADLIRRGVTIKTNTPVSSISIDSKVWKVSTLDTDYTCKNVVITSKHLLKLVKGTKSEFLHMAAESVSFQPMIRVYGKWSVPWFEGIPSFTTDAQLRYFISINPEKGIAMMSYTDAIDSMNFLKMTEKQVTKAILADLRKLFPSRSIPEPEFVAIYPWYEAASFWKPGTNPPRIIAELKNYRKDGLYIVGEWCTAHMQTWMEGSLMSVDELIA